MTRLFRIVWRSVWLSAEMVRAALHYLLFVVPHPPPNRTQACAQWLQQCCGRLLPVFAIECKVSGPRPHRGMLVANHLSYLDVIILGAVAPTVFVAKSDLRRWPVFGQFARMAGTIFVERHRRTGTSRCHLEIERTLESDVVLALFPEGTSSDGRTVLPFKSALLEPVVATHYPLFAAGLRYTIESGDCSEEICYWGEMTFLPHLLNLLGQEKIFASIRFARVSQNGCGRKPLARLLHSEVLQLLGQPVVTASL
ncbi:MAG: lysophospholipid acyltransferase family protein [Verrucomicrobiota bacterium]